MTRHLLISTTIILLITTSLTNIYAQHSSFYLDYGCCGNYPYEYEKYYPTVNINGETLAYTIVKKTGKYVIITSKWGTDTYTDTAWTTDTITYKVKMRPASVDSIIALVKNFKDTTIFKSNPGVLSGSIHFLTIANGTDTVKYELMNTFDWTALKITDIVNKYLPADNQIRATAQLIKDTEAYWIWQRKYREEIGKKNKK